MSGSSKVSPRADMGSEDSLPRRFAILQAGQKFVSNHASSAKFTLLTGVPLALKEVLDPRTKLPNSYFVVAGALQLIEAITLTQQSPTIWYNVGVLMVLTLR